MNRLVVLGWLGLFLFSVGCQQNAAELQEPILTLSEEWPDVTADLLTLKQTAEEEQLRVQLALDKMVAPAGVSLTEEQRTIVNRLKQRVQDKLADIIKVRQSAGATIKTLQARQKQVFDLKNLAEADKLPLKSADLLADLQAVAKEAAATHARQTGVLQTATDTYVDAYRTFKEVVGLS